MYSHLRTAAALVFNVPNGRASKKTFIGVNPFMATNDQLSESVEASNLCLRCRNTKIDEVLAKTKDQG